jgi:predicted AAA+ superfamily ATPase
MPKQVNKSYIPREIFPALSEHLNEPEITLITGSRQVGKTVLLEELRRFLLEKSGVPERHIISYNLDLVQDQDALHDQTAFISFLEDHSQVERLYVFVDEAQKVPEAARYFKGVYDRGLNVKLILTGSASLEAKAHFKETLAGRKRVFAISPFTFTECVRARDETLFNLWQSRRAALNQIDKNALLNFFLEYLRFGGYPRAVLAETEEKKTAVLREIYSSYVEKDAVGFWGIENPLAFRRLLKLLAAQVGQLVNVNELATNLHVDRHTVERYMLLLEETYVLRQITPYFRNPRQEIIKAGKAYFLDTGLRNIALGDVSAVPARTDRGELFESGVFTLLAQSARESGAEIHFWRTKQKAEVDFVLERGSELSAFEVKYSAKRGTIPRGLRSFIKTFSPKTASLVTLSQHDDERLTIAATSVRRVYPFDLLFE